MKRSEINKKMKELAKAGLLDNFTKEQKKCLRQLIKNQLDYIIIEDERQFIENCLFDAKKMPKINLPL
jgi:hypothetical protein